MSRLNELVDLVADHQAQAKDLAQSVADQIDSELDELIERSAGLAALCRKIGIFSLERRDKIDQTLDLIEDVLNEENRDSTRTEAAEEIRRLWQESK